MHKCYKDIYNRVNFPHSNSFSCFPSLLEGNVSFHLRQWSWSWNHTLSFFQSLSIVSIVSLSLPCLSHPLSAWEYIHCNCLLWSGLLANSVTQDRRTHSQRTINVNLLLEQCEDISNDTWKVCVKRSREKCKLVRDTIFNALGTLAPVP